MQHYTSKKDKINTKLWGYIKFKNTAFLLAFLASALAFSKRSFSSNSASKRLRLRGERLLIRAVHFARAIYKKFAFVLGVSLGPIRVHARNQQKSCILALFLSKIAVFKKGLFFDHILWKFCYEIYFAAKNLILIQKTDRSEVNKNRIS